jgi:hypothetical protein
MGETIEQTAIDDAAGTAAAPRSRPSTPYYRRMARKEARVREDQYVALSRLVQVLTRRRVVRSGPRLTENTLIRVAIDLLLERADRLAGDTESELRDSVLDAAPAAPGWAGPPLFEFGDEPGTAPGR